LYAKDESQNPTWSYKDRLCATAVTHAVETGARVITISSTGDHGASTAAYAARAGLPCVIFTLASVPETMKTLMQAYGAAVVACPSSESRWDLMRQGIERFGWYPTSGFVTPPVGSNPWGVEGYKTIAYELAEDLGWTAPDVVAGVRLTDEGVLEAQRALAREEGLYVEPSAAASLTAVIQLAARGALNAEQTIVVVLTSGGLKDPGASRAWLPPVPAADGDFGRLLTVLREAYGLALDR